MGLTQITAATSEVVTLDEAKAHCSVDGNAWDSLLEIYIAAAVEMAQDYLGRALGAQQWLLTLDGFAGDAIELPRGPVTNVDGIVFLDESRVEQTLSASIYIEDLISDPQQVVRDPEQAWPVTARGVPNAVSVTFTTGFEQPPAVVKLAVLQCVAAWFTDREAGVMPIGAQQLLRPLRVIVI